MREKRKYLAVSILALAIIGMLLLGGCVPVDGQSESEDSGGSSYFMYIFLALIFVVFYFLMIRPQRKKQKDQGNLIQELRKGDRVITIGGIYGEVDSVGELDVTLRVEGGTKLKLLKSSIASKQQIG